MDTSPDAGRDGGVDGPGGPPRRSRAGRRLLLVVVVVVALWSAGAAAMAVTGALAADAGADRLRALDRADDLRTIVEGDLPAELRSAAADLERAHGRFSSALLAPARYLPVVGRQLRAAQALTGTTLAVLDPTRAAVEEVRARLDHGMPVGSERVRLLEELRRTVAPITIAIDDADLGPSEALLGPLHRARADLARRLEELDAAAHDLAVGTTTLADLLEGPSTYVVVAANNAEMRVGSGMFLSMGALRTAGGGFTVGGFRPAVDLVLADPVEPPAEVGSLWGWASPGADWRNLGFTARFPVNAQMAADMWERQTGEHVDGVVLLDVRALAELLAVTGPVALADRTLTPEDAPSYLLHDQYLGIDDDGNAERREQLSQLAAAVLDRLDEDVDAVRLFEALRRAGTGRHLMAWSRDSDHEQLWELAGVDGELGPTSLLLGFANTDASKTDPFLDVRASVRPSGPAGTPDAVAATVTISVENGSPRGQPRYVNGLGDSRDHRGIAVLHLPGASQVLAVRGGRLVASGPDGPTLVVGIELDVPAGERRSAEVDVVLPADVAGRLHVEPGARIPPTSWRVGDAEVVDAIGQEVGLRPG